MANNIVEHNSLDSGLLFFFLLLVIIFMNCEAFEDSGDSLLFFFLLLVVLFTQV